MSQWMSSRSGLTSDPIRQQTGRGGPNGVSLRLALVVSRFNADITERLRAGAVERLERCGVRPDEIECFEVPGAFEIPGMALHLGRLGRFSAIVCLGTIIQGETPHFHYLCAELIRGVGQVALELGLPVTFGVLTGTTHAEAMARSTPTNNKGAEAAAAALEMAQHYAAATRSAAILAAHPRT